VIEGENVDRIPLSTAARNSTFPAQMAQEIARALNKWASKFCLGGPCSMIAPRSNTTT
jgi:hypothetical protein